MSKSIEPPEKRRPPMKRKEYEQELRRLQGELCNLQAWVKHKGLRAVAVFEARMDDPLRQWKLSPMDLPSRSKWRQYSRARDQMLAATDTEHAPWHIPPSDDKRSTRLNGIAHLLRLMPYQEVPRENVELPKRSKKGEYDDNATLAGRGLCRINTRAASRSRRR